MRLATVVLVGLGFQGACGRALPDPDAAIAACLDADSLTQAAHTVDVCTPVIEASPPIGSKSDLSKALVSRGVALRNLSKLDQSKADLDRAVDLAPKDAEALRMLAWTYRERDELELADGLYTKALGINDEWQGRLSRCVVRGEGLGQWEGALADCRIALQKDPNPDAYFFTIDALNRLGRYQEAVEIGFEGIKASDAEGRTYEQLAIGLDALGRANDAEEARKAGKSRSFASPLTDPKESIDKGQ